MDSAMLNCRTYKYHLYPNCRQRDRLQTTLYLCRELYNAALQERIESYKITGKGTTFNSQSLQLPEIKEIREDIFSVYGQVLQDVLHRLDKTYQSFFKRIKLGQKAGFPRFKGENRYNSFTYPQNGFKLSGNFLQLSKIGNIKIRLHRKIEGEVKTLSIIREAGNWYACFAVEFEPVPLPKNDKAIGIDVGLEYFATLSDGTVIENPRWYRNAKAQLRRAQRRVSRRKKGSIRRRKAVLILQKAHQHIKNQRLDFHHKLSHWLVQNFGTIVVEDLNVKGLSKGFLAKSVNDVGWGSFFSKLSYKAENAGRKLIKVDPSGTSQTCLCGAKVSKTLSDREHICTKCGLVAPRDLVSAQIILQRAGIPLSSDNVSETILSVA